MKIRELLDKLLGMLSNHPFWALITLAVLGWYMSVTIYVGIRGALDIKQMLRRLSSQDRDGEEQA
ncbi:MAG: hypothetical protein ACYC3X_13125 [Pirellulaceae bacterium]